MAFALAALAIARGVSADSIDDKKAAPPPGAAPSSKAVAEDPSTADSKVLSDLDAFCTKWMGFLATRERDNRQGIKWEKGSAGVVGKFVGYSTDYECKLKAPHEGAPKKGAVPVATITYREYIFQQEGASQTDAKDTTPRQTEATEVTEIFRYSAGKWVY